MKGPEFIEQRLGDFVLLCNALRGMGATQVTAGELSATFAQPAPAAQRPAKPPAQEPDPVDPKEQRQQERDGILGMMRSHG